MLIQGRECFHLSRGKKFEKIIRHNWNSRNEQEKSDLLTLAHDFIEKISKQLYLFEDQESGNILYVNQTEFIGVHYTFLYELVSKLIIKIGFDKIKNNLLLDLVILRMMEPSSKLRSIVLLDEYFGIKHQRQRNYDSATQWLTLKSKSESIALDFARKLALLHQWNVNGGINPISVVRSKIMKTAKINVRYT